VRSQRECQDAFEQLGLPAKFHQPIASEVVPSGCFFYDSEVTGSSMGGFSRFVWEGGHWNTNLDSGWDPTEAARSYYPGARPLCRTAFGGNTLSLEGTALPAVPPSPALPGPSARHVISGVVLVASVAAVLYAVRYKVHRAMTLHRATKHTPLGEASVSNGTSVELNSSPDTSSPDTSNAVPSSIELASQATPQEASTSSSGAVRNRAVPDLRDEEIHLQEIIGEGGCATVRRARWQGTMVAVKVLKTRFEAKDVYNEANLLAHLRHPCICALLGACELDVGLCLVLEYLEGGTLAQFLYPESSATCPTPYAAMVGASAPKGCLRRLQWSLDVADGLRYLHSRDVVHKDIKCSNVLLDATHTHAKVSDFGLSRSSEPVASMGSEEQSTTTSPPDSSLSACLRAESDSQYLPVPISRLSSMGSLRYLAPFTAPSDERHSSAVRFARDTCTSAGT